MRLEHPVETIDVDCSDHQVTTIDVAAVALGHLTAATRRSANPVQDHEAHLGRSAPRRAQHQRSTGEGNAARSPRDPLALRAHLVGIGWIAGQRRPLVRSARNGLNASPQSAITVPLPNNRPRWVS